MNPPTSLYRFYDASGTLLYVGITSQGPYRWREHEEHRLWWAQVASTRVEHYDNRDDAHRAETRAILSEHPLHNVIHSNGPNGVSPRVKRLHGSGCITRKNDGRWAVSLKLGTFYRQWSFRDEAGARLVLAAIEHREAGDAARKVAMEIIGAGQTWPSQD